MMKKVILKIKGMSCSACSNALEKYLNKQDGIIDATVNLVMAEALINYEDYLSIDDLNNFVKEAGYTSLGEYDFKKERKSMKKDYYILWFFIILSFLYFYISMGSMVGMPIPSLISPDNNPKVYASIIFLFTIPYMIYALDIFRNGIKNIIYRSFNMDTLVTLGVFASFSYSVYGLIMIYLNNFNYVHNLYFESSAFVIFFIKLGRFIDKKSKDKTKKAIEELVQLTPEKALLKKKDEEIEVTIDEVKVHDLLIAKPGMKIAVDGVIRSGATHIDETFISGESIPVKKSLGDKVYAGSINIDGSIIYEAENIGPKSSLSEIVRLVINATNTKAPIAHLADKVSGYFVPIIIIIAFLSLIINLIMGVSMNNVINTFVTILVVACPCALGLATPLAIVVAMGISAKNGILVKESATLENVSKIDTIIFDKTGTLTYGKLKIDDIYNYSNLTNEDLLDLASSVEKHSKHPISNAFNDIKTTYAVQDFKNNPGIGIEAKINDKTIYIGNNKLFSKLNLENEWTVDEEKLISQGCSILYIIKESEVLGLIGLRDILRENAKEIVKELQKSYRVILLSGDNEKTANIIANEVGIKEVIASCMPKDKLKIIKELEDGGSKVMMIGDGINDAPALASCTVGVSINKANEIASSSADALLIHDNLKDIINLIKISKKTMIDIKENLFWAFFYNMLMIPIALGLLDLKINPSLASIAMMFSSLSVVLNALRLKKIKLKGE